ncbi:MAG: type IV secretory system conjugative DNA transfer family protein [Clostridia bacterium]|nr:type IV secretory system conjugative DNA transfer family protein [Clostridia bacterium]
MADKSFSEKLKSYLIWGIVGFLVSIVAGGAVSILLDSKKQFSADALMNEIFSGNGLMWGAIIFAIVFLLIFLSKKAPSKSMKGKDKLENVRFQTSAEMDKTFKNCLWTDLPNEKIVGVPFNVKKQGKNLKIHFTPACHTLIIGATGTGKTVSFIEPTVQILSSLKNKPSMLVTDTKGEIYAHHSQKLKDEGYDVVLLDLTRPYNSMQWNPLEPIYDDWQRQLHLEENILRHTNDPVRNYPKFIKVGEINDEEWYEFDGKAFSTLKEALTEVEVQKAIIKDDCYENLKDICLAVCPTTNEKEKNWEDGARDYFNAVLIAMLEDSENDALGMTKEKYNFYNAYKIAMNKDDDYEVVKQYFNGRNPLSKTRQLASNIIQTQAKQTRDSFMSTLNTHLSMFSDSGICYLTSKNSIHFSEMDERPTAFFIKIPDERQTRYTLASVCLTQAYKAFVKKARDNELTNDDKMAHLKRPMFYIMDEFANLPKIEKLDTMITVSRSRWVYLNMAIQSYSQLSNVYGKEQSEIVRGQCKATIFMGTEDLSTRKEFSESLGNYTIEVQSKSKGDKPKDGGGSGESVSTQFQQRPLVFASDLDKIELGHNYSKIFQFNPVKGYVEPYFKCTDIYKIGMIPEEYIPGRRLNEQEIFYDIRKRNNIVLSSFDD